MSAVTVNKYKMYKWVEREEIDSVPFTQIKDPSLP